MGFHGRFHGDFMWILLVFHEDFMRMSWDLMKIYEDIGILARDIMGSCRIIGYNLQYETWDRLKM